MFCFQLCVNIVISVVEFQIGWVLKSNMFGQEIIQGKPSYFVNTTLNVSSTKNGHDFIKKVSPKLIFLKMKNNSNKIPLNFEIKN